MIVTYLRWRDAMSEEAAEPATKTRACLVELQEIGFLLHETDEAVCIGMELDGDGGDCMAGRWRLHVPKVNIIARRDMSLEKAFPVGRKRKPRE